MENLTNTNLVILGDSISHKYIHDVFINEVIDGKKGITFTQKDWLNYYTGCDFIMTHAPNLDLVEYRNYEFDFAIVENTLDNMVSWEEAKIVLKKEYMAQKIM